MKILPIATAAASLVACATAQPAKPPPCSGEAYRAFDFWLGSWEVFDPDGNKLGDNEISAEERGCVLIERWQSVGGGTGQSYNYYDPATDKWRQVWVSAAANIDYEGGLTDDGVMRLDGTITYRNGQSFPFFGEWTPQEDGSVKQYFEQWAPETETYKPWFLGFYKPKRVNTAP